MKIQSFIKNYASDGKTFPFIQILLKIFNILRSIFKNTISLLTEWNMEILENKFMILCFLKNKDKYYSFILRNIKNIDVFLYFLMFEHQND
jgi:hypothetical protein